MCAKGMCASCYHRLYIHGYCVEFDKKKKKCEGCGLMRIIHDKLCTKCKMKQITKNIPKEKKISKECVICGKPRVLNRNGVCKECFNKEKEKNKPPKKKGQCEICGIKLNFKLNGFDKIFGKSTFIENLCDECYNRTVRT